MSWKQTLQNNVNNVEKLKAFVDMSNEEEKMYENVAKVFPISSTTYYLNLIDPDDPHDPIKKMALPSLKEFDTEGAFDTSGEEDNTVMQGLQHKYATTALLLATNKCAMYCRHCFRKRLVGVKNNETLSFVKEAVAYIRENPQINNVLITGGDSFLIDTDLIESYLEALSEVKHLDFIRFGTRTPVVFPERIYGDEKLLSVLKKYSEKIKIYVVTQFNHPRELTEESLRSVNALIERGIVINNQTVLLKGVNDDPTLLARLQNQLVNKGIVPYYIFQCRPVKGVLNQFQLPLKEAFEIVKKARVLMNGHSKRARFCMSHETGKIEILGPYHGEMLFKYHQAKNPDQAGLIFSKALSDDEAWLDEVNDLI